jgi:hypothetical protein
MSLEEFQDERIGWQIVIDEKCNIRIGFKHDTPMGPVDFCIVGKMFI